MKAVTKCPKCNEVLTTDCEACVSDNEAIHKCKGKKEIEVFKNLKWKIIDCTKAEAKTLRKLGFKGDIPEPLE